MAKTDLELWPHGLAISHTRNDGGRCSHYLDNAQADEFYQKAHEVRLASIGYEEHKVMAYQLQPGDVFESLGQAVERIIAGPQTTQVFFANSDSEVGLVSTQPVKVNRKIQ